MFLQITNKDTLGNIATSGSMTNTTTMYLLIAVLAFGLLFYFIFKGKKTRPKKYYSSTSSKPKPIPILTKEVKKEIDIDVPDNRIKLKSIVVPDNIAIELKEPKVIPKEEIKIPTKIVEPVVIPEPEEQTKEKYIGYNPINLFAQTEPYSFPYVIMPPPNCVIKFPRKGRTGRKGFKEEAFKTSIEKYFRNSHQVYDDRLLLTKNNSNAYEPDFVLVNEKNGVNIFLDIEIDEPYEGINDIENRKSTHYQYADTNRNNAFKNRGWIVIRFAEIQVHQQPDSCCKFITDVLKSIHTEYSFPAFSQSVPKINPVKQWTNAEARLWSVEKYRERYLGIERFGVTANEKSLIELEETILGETIEEQVKDDEIKLFKFQEKPLDAFNKIFKATTFGKYISFSIRNKKTIFKPTHVNEHEVSGFCYVKNVKRTYPLTSLENLEIKDNYYTVRVAGPTIGIAKVSSIVNTAIEYKKYIRMKYTRASWQQMLVDIETGELILDRIEAEESIRTISDVQLAINALSEDHIEAYRLNSNYLTAYCNKREEQRTFRFDRIGEIEILDL
ncbi:WYL domain-containing protein [Flavobacterium sp. CAN_S2]|uniref:WYL domain-containing protein n=1 Tax=Flavobacterium sp. CAN_S2 TaxID=2787726 RepID=UPI0018CABF20